jgi:hypothetical protein
MVETYPQPSLFIPNLPETPSQRAARLLVRAARRYILAIDRNLPPFPNYIAIPWAAIRHTAQLSLQAGYGDDWRRIAAHALLVVLEILLRPRIVTCRPHPYQLPRGYPHEAWPEGYMYRGVAPSSNGTPFEHTYEGAVDYVLA